MPGRNPSMRCENRELILLVGDAESGRESDVIAEFAQQLRAECVDRRPLYASRRADPGTARAGRRFRLRLCW